MPQRDFYTQSYTKFSYFCQPQTNLNQIKLNTKMNIAVYCSARTELAPECTADARTLGQWIGHNGHTLVYGGLTNGLMGVVAQATANAGGKVTGVVPQSRINRQHEANTVSILVPTLHERKQTMEEHADAFVALDGGIGTLDEMMSALASMMFNNEPRPLLLLNRDGLYNPLIDMIRNMVSRHLVTPEITNRITLCPTIDNLTAKLSEI